MNAGRGSGLRSASLHLGIRVSARSFPGDSDK